MRHRVIFAISLLGICAVAASAREKPWIEIRSPHFRVLTNGSQRDGRDVAKEFEQLRHLFAEQYPEFRLEGGAPLVIFAALDESTAKSLEPALWKAKGAKPAGVFHHAWERQYVMLQVEAWRQGGLEIVYHEYAHSILHLNLHWLPVWLDEGLANFYGYTRFEKDKIYVGAPPRRSQLPKGSLIPIETLISVDRSSPYYHNEDKVYQFYSESWALVHFLRFGPGMDRGKRLNQFVALLQQGVEQKKAFQDVFGDFKAMDRALATYVSNFSFQAGVIPDSTQIDEKSFSSRSLSFAETEADLGGFHLWTHDLAGARALVEQALKDDPKLGFAHEEMGFLNFSDGKDREALEEFSQAYSLDPTLALSLFAKTMLSPIAASNAPADQNAFRDTLSKVLALNPQFGPAYVELARLWLRRNDLNIAFAVSRKGEQLEPTRAGYHLQSGQILLRMGKASEAATFARYVAQRWPGADHDEAVELWNAVPVEQRPAGDAPTIDVPKDTQSVEGTVKSVRCSPETQEQQGLSLMLDAGGQVLTFHTKGPFGAGFSDTIWYGADHFSLCHHIEGMRAVVRYLKPSDANFAGDIAEIEIREDLPQPPNTATAGGHP
jgi:tetratricopeptide (TPR) repeat protein